MSKQQLTETVRKEQIGLDFVATYGYSGFSHNLLQMAFKFFSYLLSRKIYID